MIGIFWDIIGNTIDTFWGIIGIFWGIVGTFWGIVGTFWGMIGTFWGIVGIIGNMIDTFWGIVGTFWGIIVEPCMGFGKLVLNVDILVKIYRLFVFIGSWRGIDDDTFGRWPTGLRLDVCIAILQSNCNISFVIFGIVLTLYMREFVNTP